MKILFCGEGFPEARRQLATLLPDDEILAFPPDQIGPHIAEADVVVPTVNRVDQELIRKGTFGLIQQFGVGLESVDIGAATKNGVMVARIPVKSPATPPRSPSTRSSLCLCSPGGGTRSLQHGRRGLRRVGVTGRPGTAREKRLHRRHWRGRKGLARRLAGFKVRIFTVDDHPGRTVPGVDIVRSFPLPGSAKQSGRQTT